MLESKKPNFLETLYCLEYLEKEFYFKGNVYYLQTVIFYPKEKKKSVVATSLKALKK